MIQELTEKDVDLLVPLFDRYMVFYRQPSDPDRYRNFLAERLRRGESKVFLAYDMDGRAVGFAQNYHSFSSVSLGLVVVLNDLYVVPDVRGQGVGSQLIERSFAYAKSRGAVRVDIGTEKTNPGAQALYKRMGFIEETAFITYNYYPKTVENGGDD